MHEGTTAKHIVAPIFAISRLRMGTDGPGITTLVTFMRCPLNCKYCINRRCHEPIYEKDGKTIREGIMLLTPQELYDRVMIDNIYFAATGGGVCFGGGEPTLYADFIKEFRRICGNRWRITVESCLCCSFDTMRTLSEVVDYWIADIKSIHSDIYESYTGVNFSVMQHLRSLQMLVPDDRVMIKVPIIPGYNDEKDVDNDIANIKQQFGFTNVKKIFYIKLQR